MRIRPQAFRVLEILVQAKQDVVTREDLRAVLWPDTTFVDFEHGLNNAIRELRRALVDSAAEPVYVETLPRVGYRLIAPVEAVVVEPDVVSLQTATAIIRPESPRLVSPGEPESHRWLGRRSWAIVACLAIALSVAAIGYREGWISTHSSDASGRVMLAVLPFENLTGDPKQDYLGDGLTQELISQLGQTNSQHLGVISRSSVMRYRSKDRSLAEIGRALQVQYAVEGTVRRDGRSIRVSVQLVDASAREVWTRTYDRPNLDVLAIQEEIAREISLEIMSKLGADANALQIRPSAPVSSEAYDLYLKGSYFFNKRSATGLQQGIYYFLECVSKAPSYAPAYASLANSYLLLRGYAGFSESEVIPKAREAATRAVTLDPNLPEAHLALALIAQNYDWDWQTAEREFRKAIELNQNYATAHHWLGEHLAFRGRFEEALAEFERARRIDPLSMIIATDEAVVFYYARQYDESISRLRAVRELEPNFGRAGMIVYVQVQKQEYEEAMKSLVAEQPVYGKNPWYWAQLAYVNGHAGNSKEAGRAMKRLKDLNRRGAVDPGVMVWASLGSHDQKQAISWLEKAYSQHSDVMLTLKVDPAFDPLRSNPRFQQLVQTVQLN